MDAMELLGKIAPTYGRIVVTKPEVFDPETEGDIIHPDMAKGKRREAGQVCEVLKVWEPDAMDIFPRPPVVNQGDKIIVLESAGVPLQHEGKETGLWFVGESDVIAVYDDSTS